MEEKVTGGGTGTLTEGGDEAYTLDDDGCAEILENSEVDARSDGG